MATERLLTRQVREILRLKYECGLPHRAIARACGALCPLRCCATLGTPP